MMLAELLLAATATTSDLVSCVGIALIWERRAKDTLVDLEACEARLESFTFPEPVLPLPPPPEPSINPVLLGVAAGAGGLVIGALIGILVTR
jgi:hypothetical protein